ncbi:hypothetical protein IFM89_000450 [Coptis chinensis]|uniref:ABC transporter domain-containing protein n=1 Tax=Coptis chinensis TaxID=261450 RepID=A0A835I9N1_9MAGN|nr:hypothetical protein IFM89_000450 [Coptis chinensis]
MLGCGIALEAVDIVSFIIFCSYGLAVWFGSLMIIRKGYTGGDVIIVLMAIVTSSITPCEVSPCMKAFAAGKAAAYSMFETMNIKPDIDSSDTGGRKLDDICGDIRDVYFRYPTRPHEQILAGLSLAIPSGMTVALVGESGSDQEKIGLVSQEPVLFASSIRDNVSYGKENATMEEIRAAKLPQKQRVAIARAILRNPRILLLDEATSALDAESEWSVQEALDRFMTGRTTIIVAHQLGTVRNSDMIAVIHDGKMKYEEASGVANDAVRNIRTVFSFCAQENVIALYRNKCQAPKKAGIKLGLITRVGFGLSFFFLFSSYAISFYVGAQLVRDGIILVFAI